MFAYEHNKLFRMQLRWIYRTLLRFDTSESPRSGRKMNGLLCPSYPSDIGTQVLGRIDPRSGTTQFEESSSSAALAPHDATTIPVGIPRFYGSCRTTTCAHWTGSSCRLAKSIALVRVSRNVASSSCQIRQSCRWYAEHGIRVCGGCAKVEYRLISSNEKTIRNSSTEEFLSIDHRVM